MTTPHITDVRQHLLATLADLRSRDNPMDVERARAVSQVAAVLVESAKVEVDYIKAVKADHSGFLEPAPQDPRLPLPSSEPTAHNPFPASVRHVCQ